MTNGENFNKAIQKVIEKHGAGEDPEHFYKWSIETIYGSLKITTHEPEKRQKLFSIFCRFDEPKRVPAKEYSNPHSGKWNFHNLRWKDSVEIFEHNLKKILLRDPTITNSKNIA